MTFILQNREHEFWEEIKWSIQERERERTGEKYKLLLNFKITIYDNILYMYLNPLECLCMFYTR